MKAWFQRLFERWGLPQGLRFDNGQPWGGLHGPTGLALWLCGLGIRLHFGRPSQSTDNAVVERCHGVLTSWVEPSTCATLSELAERLTTFAHLQRESYPACHGQPRCQAYPTLSQPVRPYHPTQDPLLWQRDRVLVYVASFTFERTVEKNGRITLMAHEYSLSRKYSRQRVTLRLDPLTAHWLVSDRDGEVIGSFLAAQFTYDTIANLKMTFKDFKAKVADVSNGVYPYVA